MRFEDVMFSMLKVDPKEIGKDERKTVVITISKRLHEKLVRLSGMVISSRGTKYPLSFLMEDMLAWILSDKERLMSFLRDAYELQEGFPALFRSSRYPSRKRGDQK